MIILLRHRTEGLRADNGARVFSRGKVKEMKADLIIKNAKIFTADSDNPEASAMVVKDGRFVYVGDESGLSDYEGETMDLAGAFLMPGIIDSHVHVALSVAFEYADMGIPIDCSGKKDVLESMAEAIREDPRQSRYRFVLARASLQGEDLTKEDLDVICPDGELMVIEEECHSIWVNSRLLARFNITDDTPDPRPGLSYYVRRDGHVTGNIYEVAIMRFLLDGTRELTDEQIDRALIRWIDNSVGNGVTCVFDAGIPDDNEFLERVYTRLRNMDRQGKLPVYVDGCYLSWQPDRAKNDLDELGRFSRVFDTEHLKVHTLKIFLDGTLKIETAALITPYEDTRKSGTTYFYEEELSEVLRGLNEAGFDLHLHTVGEGASRMVLDSVETVKKELGDRYRVKVTCAHLEIQDDADLSRFAELGVFADFTPWWHAGNEGGTPLDTYRRLLGDRRANNMYRCKTLWDSGALVTWSSDEVFFGNFYAWNPYLGMEVGMTRHITEKTKTDEWNRTVEAFPPDSERMGIIEMLLGYTINGAIQLGIEDRKGSIEVGKDADFLIFDNDLLTVKPEGLSHSRPREVYIRGRRIFTLGS